MSHLSWGRRTKHHRGVETLSAVSGGNTKGKAQKGQSTKGKAQRGQRESPAQREPYRLLAVGIRKGKPKEDKGKAQPKEDKGKTQKVRKGMPQEDKGKAQKVRKGMPKEDKGKEDLDKGKTQKVRKGMHKRKAQRGQRENPKRTIGKAQRGQRENQKRTMSVSGGKPERESPKGQYLLAVDLGFTRNLKYFENIINMGYMEPQRWIWVVKRSLKIFREYH